MASCEGHIEALVNRVQEMMLKFEGEDSEPCLFLSPSAYDTAWLAMVPDFGEERERRPMFAGCLDWILENQRPEGFWGERDCHGYSTIDSLTSTLACIVALKTWGLGHDHIQKGMAFINSTSAKLLTGQGEDDHSKYPCWFVIVFPAMLELARDIGEPVTFPDDVKEVLADVFRHRHHVLETKKQVEGNYDHHPPFLAYLEALPPTYKIDNETILSNLDHDGSLFQSPSATAAAYLATGDHQALSYLRRLLPNCTSGVPSIYPIDEDFIRLYVVHEIQALGLSEYFPDEIKGFSEHMYRKYNDQQPPYQKGLAPAKLFKDSLAFQLLRLQGYDVSPNKLCWFLNDAMALEYIEDNYDKFSSMLYSLYRATNLMFQGETELQDLRSFSRRLLEKTCLRKITNDDITMWPHLQEVIKRELSIPWMARMDHLENRKWIEENHQRTLWLGKASYYRIPCIDNKDLFQLAKENYKRRQLVYRKELEELLRWSKASGLMDMGFAREKTIYSYFAVASSVSFPCDSDVRLIVAKSTVLVTIADDFFDMEGSLKELDILTRAIQSWDNKGITSHSKILFDALDNFVAEIAEKYLYQHGIDITNSLRGIWSETFASWLMEATWSRTGQIPSLRSYLETGMISITAHNLVLLASCDLTPTISPQKIHPPQYEDITNFLMISCRLLNDIQSYEKELKDGKNNSVVLYLLENPGANLEEAIDYVQSMLDDAKMRMLEHALRNDLVDLPESFKKLHLGCLKAFQMFFNSANHFDSKESLLSDINQAFFIPLEFDEEKNNLQPSKPMLPLRSPRKSTYSAPVLAPISNCLCQINIKHHHHWRSPFAIPRMVSRGNHRVQMHAVQVDLQPLFHLIG